MIMEQAIKEKVLISPAAGTAGSTTTGVLDTLGGDYATVRVLINLGATATLASANGVTVSLATADTNNTTAFVTLSGSSLTGIKNSQEVVYQVNTQTKQRFVQLSVTAGTNAITNEAGTFAAVGTMSQLGQNPSSAGAEVTGTNDQVVIL